ncbi:MAG: HU family DNA-binding protein [Myxococcales bacterium]|nr:HU family DNA-binding protein [Myxococcales bacterium]
MATGKRMTKAQIVGELAEKTNLSKKEISGVFDGLRDLIKRELGRRGPGEFVIPDLLKLKVKKVKATPAGRRQNPFTKEMQDYPAKPASKKVRATPLKKLKDLVS